LGKCNGPPFQGHQFREYAEKKGFYHHRITPKHPQANGESERFMRNLNKAIRIAEKENTDYKEKIEGMLVAYRATPQIFPTMKRKVDDKVIRNCDE
jgi:transposase InsO family protein